MMAKLRMIIEVVNYYYLVNEESVRIYKSCGDYYTYFSKEQIYPDAGKLNTMLEY